MFTFTLSLWEPRRKKTSLFENFTDSTNPVKLHCLYAVKNTILKFENGREGDGRAT